MKPIVTIAILNHNRFADLSICLQSIRKLNYSNLKTVIIDNGSDSSEVVRIKKLCNDRVKLIHFNNNLSFSVAYNRALREIDSKYIFLINNDTKLTSRIINILVEYADKNPDVAIIQPKLLSLKNKNMFDYSGACGGYVDKLGYPYCRGRIVFDVERDTGQYDGPDNPHSNDIFWASGAAMFARYDAVKEVGFFDENLESYAEDNDLCWKILKRGLRIVSLPSAVLYHKSMGSWGKYLTQKTYLIHRNHLLLLLKHLTLGRLLFVLPIRIILDYFSIYYYLTSGVSSFSISVLRAHLDFLRLFNRFWRKRTDKNVKQEIFIEKNLMKPTSVIWAYFWQKKRKFSELPPFSH